MGNIKVFRTQDHVRMTAACISWRRNAFLLFCLLSCSISIIPSFAQPGQDDTLIALDLEEGITEQSGVDVGVVQVEENWEDPPPPQKLRIKTSQEGTPIASFNWEPPPQNIEQGSTMKVTAYKITLESLTPFGDEFEAYPPQHHLSLEEGMTYPTTPISFLVDSTHFTTDKLISLLPGGSYGVKVQSEWHTRLSPPIDANFTLPPNPPDRFVVWYRNETCFLVLWQPPTHGVFHSYKVQDVKGRAELSPRESPISTLFVTRWDYQFGGVRPGFCSLTPGRAYNISVATVSGGEGQDEGLDNPEWVESSPVVKEYRTMPLPVTNVTISVLRFKGTSTQVLVEWEPPSLSQGEHDGFNIYIKRAEWGKPTQKFIPRTKPPLAHLDDDGLIPGEKYDVIIKTVSGKVSSTPVVKTFSYFLPPPLSLPEEDSDSNFHLQSAELK